VGLGDWIASLNQEAVKAYLATLKQNVEEKLPESIKLKLQGGGTAKDDTVPAEVEATD
jgi:ABC-type nitrate/sulfonate/bicarbonate transport system substrate-binding protein